MNLRKDWHFSIFLIFIYWCISTKLSSVHLWCLYNCANNKVLFILYFPRAIRKTSQKKYQGVIKNKKITLSFIYNFFFLLSYREKCIVCVYYPHRCKVNTIIIAAQLLQSLSLRSFQSPFTMCTALPLHEPLFLFPHISPSLMLPSTSHQFALIHLWDCKTLFLMAREHPYIFSRVG